MVSNISSEPGGTLCSKAGFKPRDPKPSTSIEPHHYPSSTPLGVKKALRSKGLLTLRSYPALKGEIC